MLKWILGDNQELDQDKALGLLDAWINGMAEVFGPLRATDTGGQIPKRGR